MTQKSQRSINNKNNNYPQFYIEESYLDDSANASKNDNIQGYSIFSTAPINVEDNEDPRDGDDWLKEFWSKKIEPELLDHKENISQQKINQKLNEHNSENIKNIIKHVTNSEKPGEITISIHGYSMTWKDVDERNKKIYNRVSSKYQCESINDLPKQVFIGYRWSAENPVKDQIPESNEKIKPISAKDKIINALISLPISSVGILIIFLSIAITNSFFKIFFKLYELLYHNTEFIFSANIDLLLYVAVSFVLSLLFSISISNLLLNQANKDKPIDLKQIYNSLLLCTVFTVTTTDIILNLNTIINYADVPWWNRIISLKPRILIIVIKLLLEIFDIGLDILSIAIVTIITSLILLRLSNYFRDKYRASHYGVLDLVELIRKLDDEVNHVATNDKKIKINFIAHSMGCFVLTETIRILSDVFDNDAINGNPKNNIGDNFSLGRIVLVAPDIPLNSIITQRSNFLISSISRCEEVYVFSNEADVVLRFMSTFANYISFPMRERINGFRLGNISINYLKDGTEEKEYGIKNCNLNDGNIEALQDGELQVRMSKEFVGIELKSDKEVVNKITFFDLTDYIENGQGLLSFADRKKYLNYNFFGDYSKLCRAHFFSKPRQLNTHGGYFHGEFSQELIYGLAFLGFYKFVENRVPDMDEENTNLSPIKALNNLCKKKQIQVILDQNLAEKDNDKFEGLCKKNINSMCIK